MTYLVDANGAEVAAYTYDPYGKILTATGEMAAVNPLQYCGDYHDSETGFYYLQSRYYDPEICRFINADSYASTGQSYLGYYTVISRKALPQYADCTKAAVEAM